MALLHIVKYPDPVLRTKCDPVTDFSPEAVEAFKKTVQDMSETMAEAKGIGLAAIQVAIPKRFLIIDIGDLSADEKYVEGDAESEKRLAEKKKTSKIEVFVNPKILDSDGEIEYEEGCLSVPGVYATVRRKDWLKLEYQDIEGNTHVIETEGLKSIVLQHEMDHLDGIVFPDRLGPMQKMMVLNKYKKLQNEVLKV